MWGCQQGGVRTQALATLPPPGSLPLAVGGTQQPLSSALSPPSGHCSKGSGPQGHLVGTAGSWAGSWEQS